MKKEDFLENVHILCCFVQLKIVLFNLLCVLDLFSFFFFFFPRTLAVNSVSDFSLSQAAQVINVKQKRLNNIVDYFCLYTLHLSTS